MIETLDFPGRLRLIDERATAFRAAVAAAPALDVQVPTCPEWTLLDLVRHLGEGRLRWATTVAAGPSDTPPPPAAPADLPEDREALLDWFTDSTRQLLDALREAGPDRGCWTWWGKSQSPKTSGAVARHQLQQMLLHTYDAQVTVGAAEPLPEPMALDGIGDFLYTCCATDTAWPHEPAIVDYHVVDGSSWRVVLGADGALITDVGDEPADVSASGTASDLVLFFYGRITMDQLKVEGDRTIFDRLIAWDPGI